MNILDNLAQRIIGKSFKLIAIDGVDASGKTYFAYQLSARLNNKNKHNIVVSIDDFHHSKEIRYTKGKDSAEGFYLDSYQYDTFIKECILPFRAGSNQILTHAFDLEKDVESLKYMNLHPETILIIEGIFLHRDELYSIWDYSIYLDIERGISLERNLLRSSKSDDTFNIESYKQRFFSRYQAGQELYQNQCSPKSRASIVIDNSDFYNPKAEYSKS